MHGQTDLTDGELMAVNTHVKGELVDSVDQRQYAQYAQKHLEKPEGAAAN